MKEKVQQSFEPGAPVIDRFELRLKDGVSEGKHVTNGKIALVSKIWVARCCQLIRARFTTTNN
jgi:hypothetical protein